MYVPDGFISERWLSFLHLMARIIITSHLKRKKVVPLWGGFLRHVKYILIRGDLPFRDLSNNKIQFLPKGLFSSIGHSLGSM